MICPQCGSTTDPTEEHQCPQGTPPGAPQSTPPESEEHHPPVRPRATGGIHALASVVGIFILLFDGFLAMDIINQIASLVQYRTDPQAILNALPPKLPAQIDRAVFSGWMQHFFMPITEWTLIWSVGSLLLILGVIGFLQRKRWSSDLFFLGFGIQFVDLIALSTAMGSLMRPLQAASNQPVTPDQFSVGLTVLLIIIWLAFAVLRGIPALILHTSARLRREEFT